MPAPLLLFSGTQSGLPGPILTLDSSARQAIGAVEKTLLSNFTSGITNAPPGFATSVQILAGGSVPGLLQPGASNQVAIYYAGWLEPWDFNRPPLIFTLGSITAEDTALIDWATFGQQARPGGLSDAAWAVAFTNLENQIGPTWGGYVAALNRDAASLWQLGLPASSVSNLFSVELRTAQGLGSSGISGFVVDAAAQRPLPGVIINGMSAGSRSAASATTDATGFFALTGLSEGVQNLTMSNYFIVSNSVVTITNGINVAGLVIVASKAGQINGYVTAAATGEPLTSVLVSCASQTTGQNFRVLSGPNGSYNFSTLPADTYVVSCALNGYVSNNLAGIGVASGQTISNVRLSLTSGATISGVAVQPSDGSRVGGLTLQLQNSASGMLFTTTTGADGAYQFNDLPAGAYVLEGILNGAVFETISNLQAGAGQALNGETLTVGGATLSGSVVAETNGSPISNAQVALYSNGTIVSASKSGTNGRYEIQGIANGSYNLGVTAAGYAPATLASLRMTGVATQMSVSLGAPARITGVALFNGHVASNVFAVAQPEGSSNIASAAVSGSNGAFNIPDLAGGNYVVSLLDSADGAEFQTGNLSVPAGGQLNLGSVALTAAPGAVPAIDVNNYFLPEAALTRGNGARPKDAVEGFPPPLSLDAPGWEPYPFEPENSDGFTAQAILTAERFYLETVWIPASFFFFGSATADIWQTFLETTYEDPAPINLYSGDSQIVVGKWPVLGFSNSTTTAANISTIESDANDFIMQTYGSMAAGNSSFSMQLNLEDILSSNPGQLIYTPPTGFGWNFNDKYEIPGNLAGGAGGGYYYPDSRWVTGPVSIEGDGENLCITYNPTLSVLDHFGFGTGYNPGGLDEQAATLAFACLESYDEGFDVTFEVQCKLGQNTVCLALPPPPPPPDPPCENCTAAPSEPVGSEDPNAKIGPAGFGAQNWVRANISLPYTINFENASNATAPAQIVTLSDPLSTNFNWMSFQLAEIGFGSNSISIPPNSQYFATNVSVSYLGMNFVVQIEAGIDLSDGEVYANFNSVDPVTDLAPPVNIGFLPPEDGTGRGQGRVSFSVQPKPGVAEGAQITNIAFIEFDQNPIIATDQANDDDPSQGIDTNKIVLVTIDNVPPVSAVAGLPGMEASPDFSVCWSGTDAGSGIVNYDIYVSTNGGPFGLWLASTTNLCASFNGQFSQSYAFYSLARDGAGNEESLATVTNATQVGPPSPRPVIVEQPVGGVCPAGSNFTFTVEAGGSPPLKYQWEFNKGHIAGATNSSLTLTNMQASKAGSYLVVAANSAGAATSSNAVLSLPARVAIKVQPASKLNQPAGALVSFSVTASGSAPLSYQWSKNGNAIARAPEYSGVTASNLIIDPALAGDAGSYSVTVSNSLGAVVSKFAMLSIAADKTAPSVTIVSPAANARVTNAAINGAAVDNAQVARVAFWLTNINNGIFAASQGQAVLSGAGAKKTWAITNQPAPGTNILAVQSWDVSSNPSPIVTRNFFYKLPARLALAKSGNGNGTLAGKSPVTGDAVPSAGAELNIGEGYSIAATPDVNSFFSNWSGSITSTTNGTLKFIMEPGLSIQANFVTNYFIGAAGVYDGLFFITNHVSKTTAGLLNGLTVGKKGAYSGKLALDGTNYGFTGAFNLSGQSAANVARLAKFGGPVGLSITLDWSRAPAEVTGAISGTNGGPWTAALTAELAGNNQSSAEYTMSIPPASQTGAPPGSGYALITNHSGSVTLTGTLADGTSFNETVPASVEGRVPVYASVYNNTGLLFGWINIGSGEPQGQLTWVKPASILATLYPNGFTNVVVVMGSRWTYPEARTPALPLANGQLSIAGGGLSGPRNYTVIVSNNAVAAIGPNSNGFVSGAIDPKTGAVTIKFLDGTTTVSALGAALQNSASAAGYFTNKSGAGSFILGP